MVIGAKPYFAVSKSSDHETRRRVMARAGDEIVNPRTSQRMVFLKTGEVTNGELVQIDTYNPPTGVPEPEHVHPFQESGAEVISGSLRFRVGGEVRSVKAGESITIPANTPHHFWNDGEEEAHFIQWFRPALKIDRFFETLFGLAHDGKLNDKGLPSLLQLAVSVPYFGDEIRLTSPPWAVQRVIFGVLAPIGRLLGYRAQYPYPRAKTHKNHPDFTPHHQTDSTRREHRATGG
jgi:quercetin dioxygenase-like cupin family protein